MAAPVRGRRSLVPDRFLHHIERGHYTWTWQAAERELTHAAHRLRAWLHRRFGDLDRPSSLSTSSNGGVSISRTAARVSWAIGPIRDRPSRCPSGGPASGPRTFGLGNATHSVAREQRPQAASRGPGCSLPCSHGRNHTRRSWSSMLRAPLPDRPFHLQLRSPVLHARRHQDACSLRAQGVKVWVDGLSTSSDVIGVRLLKPVGAGAS